MVTKKKISDRGRKILGFIREFMQENGIPPTVRDIQSACDISSTSVVDYNLRLLERDGYMHRRPDVARGIELLDGSGNPVSNSPRVPILGLIAAGMPLPVFSTEGAASNSDFDTIEVSPELARRYDGLFALSVKGTSMIDALVDDGDVVVVQPCQLAGNGAMVVAWLKSSEEATLKKFYLEGDKVRLQPANSTMDPIYCDATDVEIKGRVVSVIRKY